MLGVAYVGAKANCPLGGVTTITMSPNGKVICPEGLIATAGSTGVCSFHTTFSAFPTAQTTVMGQPVLRVGDATTCGGVIIEGSGKVLVK